DAACKPGELARPRVQVHTDCATARRVVPPKIRSTFESVGARTRRAQIATTIEFGPSRVHTVEHLTAVRAKDHIKSRRARRPGRALQRHSGSGFHCWSPSGVDVAWGCGPPVDRGGSTA